MATSNLDDLRRLRSEGMSAGAGSGRWIKAAQALMDQFPAYYDTAKQMNASADRLRGERLVLADLIDSCVAVMHTVDGDCGLGSDGALDALIDRAARAALAVRQGGLLQVAATKPLDDPRLQELFSCAIDGALTSGYQNVAPAPAGHWLEYWWKKGRAVASAPTTAKPPSDDLNVEVHAQLEALVVVVLEITQVLRMVDDNIRIAAGEKRKAWGGSFVTHEVRRALSLVDKAVAP